MKKLFLIGLLLCASMASATDCSCEKELPFKSPIYPTNISTVFDVVAFIEQCPLADPRKERFFMLIGAGDGIVMSSEYGCVCNGMSTPFFIINEYLYTLGVSLIEACKALITV